MNASRRSILAAVAAAALMAAGCASTEPESRRSVGETAGDAAVTAKVKTAIATDVGARTATAVNVNTYNGVVQLTGFVDSDEQKRRAEEAAKQVDGVKSVKNDIRIKSPG